MINTNYLLYCRFAPIGFLYVYNELSNDFLLFGKLRFSKNIFLLNDDGDINKYINFEYIIKFNVLRFMTLVIIFDSMYEIIYYILHVPAIA